MDMKKISAALLALCLTGTGLTLSYPPELPEVYAASELVSGTCGEKLTWTVDQSTGVLTISGKGNMDNYAYVTKNGTLADPTITFRNGYKPPWYDYKDSITSIVVEEGVTCIGETAFMGLVNVKSMSLPSTLKELRRECFENLSSIEYIDLPDSIVSIGAFAFECCLSLKKIDIPDSVVEMGGAVFLDCRALEEVRLSENISELSATFSGCQSLKSVSVPESVKTIRLSTFTGCTALTSVVLPSGLSILPEANIFGGCTSLPEITFRSGCKNFKVVDGVLFSKDMTTLYTYPSSKKDSTYTVPDTVETIVSGAFSTTVYLTELTVPEGVTSCGSGVFSSGKVLRKLTLPDSLKEIGANTCYECAKLTDVRLPAELTAIPDNFIGFDAKITQLDLPESITSIGQKAFQGCSGLTNLHVPANITAIGQEAYALSGIRQAIIPAAVSELPTDTFFHCRELSSITILDPDCVIYDSDRTICDSYSYSADKASYSGIIYGYKNSTAQAYAEKYGYRFAALDDTFIKGDVNNDGVIDGTDATMVLRDFGLRSAYLPSYLNSIQQRSADVNEDGMIDGTDATLILRYYSAELNGMEPHW